MPQRTVRKKRKLGSFPYLSVVFSTFLAISVMGVFGLMVVYVKNLSDAIQRNIEIQVFLDRQITQSEIDYVSRTVSQSAFVRSDEGPAYRYISREEAAEKFIEDTGEDFTDFIGDNPLRDALVVGVAAEYQVTDSLSAIKTNLESLRGVYEVTYEQNLIEKINDNLAKIGMALGGLSLFLLLVVVILINNTIKLALFSQRFLIRSMQLVGATNAFIKRPFLMRSIIYGLISGITACAGLYMLVLFGNRRITNLGDLQNNEHLMILFGMLVLVSVLVGYFSTRRAMRKYLKLSLDDLY